MIKSIEYIRRAIQIDLNLEKWSDAWGGGVKLSKSKSIAIVFKNKLIGYIQLNLSLCNSPLVQVKTAKFLGVIFDQALKFNHHIDYIVNRCKAGLNLLSGTNGGLIGKRFWLSTTPMWYLFYNILVQRHWPA